MTAKIYYIYNDTKSVRISGILTNAKEAEQLGKKKQAEAIATGGRYPDVICTSWQWDTEEGRNEIAKLRHSM